jgi:hypothetical protein
MKRTDIKTLIEAMRILSEGIQSEDGVANAAIAEAADRLQEQDYFIKQLLNAGDELCACADQFGYTYTDDMEWIRRAYKAAFSWNKLKESKP